MTPSIKSMGPFTRTRWAYTLPGGTVSYCITSCSYDDGLELSLAFMRPSRSGSRSPMFCLPSQVGLPVAFDALFGADPCGPVEEDFLTLMDHLQSLGYPRIDYRLAPIKKG